MTSLLAKLDARITQQEQLLNIACNEHRGQIEIVKHTAVIAYLKEARQAVLELRLAVEAINPQDEPEENGAASMQRAVLALIGES